MKFSINKSEHKATKIQNEINVMTKSKLKCCHREMKNYISIL